MRGTPHPPHRRDPGRHHHGELVAVRDGSKVIVRPVYPDDRELFLKGFTRLGERSRERRFFTAKHALTDRELFFFTNVDHHDHEAIGAVDPETGAGLGVARYIRLAPGSPAAEAAVAVIDEWQGRGLGGLLLDRLAERAAAEGVTHFEASMLTENRAMLRLFDRLGAMRSHHEDAAVIGITVELPVDVRRPSHLVETLRAVAAGEAELAETGASARFFARAKGPSAVSEQQPPDPPRPPETPVPPEEPGPEPPATPDPSPLPRPAPAGPVPSQPDQG